MNVERQDIDPRESVVRDEFESALTDDESEDEEIRKQMEALEKQKKELELRLQRKQIAKAQHLEANPSSKSTKPSFFQDLPPINKTGNSIVDKLNASKRQQQLQQHRSIELKKSRVYTFDDTELEYDIKECNEVEKYSGNRIIQRYISSTKLDAFFRDKKILRMEKLFAKVSPPNFKEPDYYNWCVIGVIVKKSEPMFTTSNKSSKFMKITISDFKLSIELTLFDQAFKKYWKLRVGDLIAILNPQIWINRNKKLSTNINAFNLTLKHDYNSILEIGKADIKYCQSFKKNGENCKNVIANNENHCYYHQELAFKKTTAKRMELNGSFRMYDPVDNGVRQQVLYIKDDKIKGEIFNDPLAEKTDRYTQLSKKFSNTQAAKAFFNDDLMNIKQHYIDNQQKAAAEAAQQGGGNKKRKLYKDEREPELSLIERQKVIKQKLKASIIRDEFKKPKLKATSNNKNDDNDDDDDDDDLEIIF